MIINPNSKELNVLRKSIFSIYFLFRRNFQDISLFNSSVFYGKPGEQQTVIGAVKSGQINKVGQKTRNVDIFDMKTDVIKTLIEMGINEDHLIVSDKSKLYHPGRSGSVNPKTNNSITCSIWRNSSINHF